MKINDQNSPPNGSGFVILYLPPLGYGLPERLAILHDGKTLGPFTYPEADGLLDTLMAFRRHHPPGLATVLQLVAAHYDVDVQKLVERCRVPAIAWARQVAMSLCSEFFNQDSKQLAPVFGCHDSLVRVARKRMLRHQKTPEGRAELESLRARIRSAIIKKISP